MSARPFENDGKKFAGAYKEMLDSCYSCYLLSGKAFLRLKVPERPEATVIHFSPEQ